METREMPSQLCSLGLYSGARAAPTYPNNAIEAFKTACKELGTGSCALAYAKILRLMTIKPEGISIDLTQEMTQVTFDGHTALIITGCARDLIYEEIARKQLVAPFKTDLTSQELEDLKQLFW